VVIIFGLKNVSATCQKTIINHNMKVYIGDINVK
jgi:hypothetical protein